MLTAICCSMGQVFAGPINITDIIGGWVNPSPLSVSIINVANQGTDTVRWSGPATDNSGQSGYNFTPGADLIPAPVDSAFLLGNFQHINNPVFPPSLDSIDYGFGFSTNGTPNVLSTTFNFIHDETNNSSTCSGGVSGPSVSNCDDFVDISSVSLNQLITVGADQYYFNLLGFSVDAGLNFSNQFQSPEGGTNSAGLYGILTTKKVNVPEPGSLALLAFGLVGLGLSRRKSQE